MYKIIFKLSGMIFGLFLLPSITSANFFPEIGISNIIPVVNRIDNATQSWSGSLITNFDIAGVPNPRLGSTSTLSKEMYYDNVNGSFSGFFVLTAACATTNCKSLSNPNNWDESAFIAFNHGVVGKEAKLVLESGDIYKMKGFAWSKSSGWISFDTGRPDTVIYDRSTGLFDGFAWSKNLGYISMKGLSMIAQVPKIDVDVTVANHDATLNLKTFTGVVNDLDDYEINIDYWDHVGQYPKSSTNGSFTGIDVRFSGDSSAKFKEYEYTIQDPFGNSSTSKLKVVANEPKDLRTDGKVIVAPLSGKQLDSKLSQATKNANGNDTYKLTVNLHDEYGNPVVTSPGIKKVSYYVQVDNSVKENQTVFSDLVVGIISDTPESQNTKRSILLDGTLATLTPDNTIKTLSDQQDEDTASYSGSFDADGTPMEIAIKSYMPTNGLSKVPGNNLKITASYRVESLTGATISVGKTTGDITMTGIADLDFEPDWVLDVANTQLISTNTDGKFGLNLPFETSLSWIKSSNDFGFSGNTYNLYGPSQGSDVISFSGSDKVGDWTDSSGIEWDQFDKGNTSSFNLIPQVDINGLPDIDFDLNHNIVRIFTSPVGKFAYSLGGAAGTGVTQNRGIKIIGTASTSNSGSIFALNTQDEYTKIGNFSKPQVKDFVQQNVEAIIRNPSSDTLLKDNASPELDSGDSDSWQSKQTIIVRNKDLIISTNVPALSNGKPRAIIVINGDIKITSAVQSIQASIFTNKGLYAIDSTGSPIDDSSRSSQQLYIFGTLISGNTVGTSAQSANGGACPDFLPKTCSPDQKKQYDLNFLRTGPSPGNVVVSEYPEYPVVIRYNPKLTSDPPPGFKKIAR